MTDLTIQMEVNYFQLNRAEYYVPLMIKIPGSELALARRGGAEHTVIDFIGEIKDDFGSTIQNIRDNVDIKLTGETAAELAKKPIQYDTGYTLLPGTYTIKFLARDDETGRIGTYIQQVRDPESEQRRQADPDQLGGIEQPAHRYARGAVHAGKDKDQAGQSAGAGRA